MSFYKLRRVICFILLIDVIGIAYVTTWLAMAASAIISFILIIVCLLAPNMSSICKPNIIYFIDLLFFYCLLLAYAFFLCVWKCYHQEKTLRIQFLTHKYQQKVFSLINQIGKSTIYGDIQ